MTFLNRRNLMGRLAALCSAVGAGTLITQSAFGRNKSDNSVRKLNRDGKPADGRLRTPGKLRLDQIVLGARFFSNDPTPPRRHA